MIAFLVLVLAVSALLLRRSVVRKRLAGQESTRPVFSVSPPAGRLGRMKDGHL